MKIVLESGSIADAVNKAARVAPTRGPAVYKAGGILLEVGMSADEPLVLKATDLDVTYRQRLHPISIEGEPVAWRIPSVLLAGILGTLPLGAGNTVTIEDTKDGALKINSGRSKAKLRMYADEFPVIGKFDPAGMVTVPDLGRRIAQVAWAAHKTEAPISGVHISGKEIVALDRYAMAKVPCDVPIESPITVPIGAMSPFLKNSSDVQIRALDDRLHLMTDEDTQITSVIFGKTYPDFMKLDRDTYTEHSTVDKQVFEQAVQRMLVLVKTEESPVTRLEFADGTINIFIEVPEVGLMQDEIDASGGPADEFAIWFTPQYMLSAVGGSTKSEVKFSYGPTAKHGFRVTDGSGYEAIVMPRAVTSSGVAVPVKAA